MNYRCPPRYNDDFDPAPNFPTLEEIQIAEELRHRLELKLISSSDLQAEQFGGCEYDWADRYVA